MRIVLVLLTMCFGLSAGAQTSGQMSLSSRAGGLAGVVGDIAGEWHGPGYALLGNGERVFVQCRVSYDRQSDSVLAVRALCATASVKLLQTGSISKVDDQRYIGTVRNEEHGMQGRVRIERQRDELVVHIAADSGSARLVLRRR
ncbi:MAG: hypothetical protein RLZ98_50 [Pseudomonadota bacterium]|jgi:hypothetical protein